MVIEIDKIDDQQVEEIFISPRLTEMFYKVKSFANMEIGLHDIESYMKRKKFNFSVSKAGKGYVYMFVTDGNNGKYTFKY